MQFDAMAEMRDKHRESAKDPVFKKTADHYLDFRRRYAVWGTAPGEK